MSLINEALKKAQSDRPAGPKHLVAAQLGVPGHPQPTPRKKNYLWGFLMSVIIVGLFSAGMSTFLVYYILGNEQPSTEAADAEPATVMMATEEKPDEPSPTEAVLNEQTPKADKVPQPTISKETVPVVEDQPAVASAVPVPQPAPAPAVVIPQPEGQPNAAVWARLEQLEIRGILGGGTKVLVFDLSTGKTKSFVEGDLVDGPLGLQILTLKSNAIVFKDYGGFQYNKSF